MALRVRYRFWYISLPSSAKQRREMTKFEVLCRTWTQSTHASEFSFFYLNRNFPLQSQLLDCSATLDRLKELTLWRRSLKYLEVIFKVTFSLALPSWLLKLPNSSELTIFVSFDWLSSHGIWALLPCSPNMVNEHSSTKLKDFSPRATRREKWKTKITLQRS